VTRDSTRRRTPLRSFDDSTNDQQTENQDQLINHHGTYQRRKPESRRVVLLNEAGSSMGRRAALYWMLSISKRQMPGIVPCGAQRQSNEPKKTSRLACFGFRRVALLARCCLPLDHHQQKLKVFREGTFLHQPINGSHPHGWLGPIRSRASVAHAQQLLRRFFDRSIDRSVSPTARTDGR